MSPDQQENYLKKTMKSLLEELQQLDTDFEEMAHDC